MHLRTLLLTLSALAAFPLLGWAQGVAISGAVTDSISRAPLLHATVLLRRDVDSTLVGAALSDDRGAFRLAGILPGRYRLTISYLGYRSLERALTVEAGRGPLDLGRLELTPQDYRLAEVTVREDRIPVTIKKDTLEFDAAAFPVRENAAVEELLRKLPGVEVERDGTIRAMGEQVREVTVDGNPFFGSDPQVATRNLPADAIDKVQVIDKKSDQAQFTGMDDGNTQKSINLTLKKDKKNGLFGNVELGGGSQERYAGRLSLNRFRGPNQLSLLGGANNINQLGFSMQDAMNFGGLDALGGGDDFGGGGGGPVIIRMSPGGGPGGALPGSNTGITTAWSGGLNFRRQWGRNLTANGSYFFSQTDLGNEQERRRQNLLGDGRAFGYDEMTQTDNERYGHRLNLNVEYKIDSLSSLQFKPSLNVAGQRDDNRSQYGSLSPEGAPLSTGVASTFSDFATPSGRAELLFRQRFLRPGRTFSAFFGAGFNQSEGEQRNESFSTFFTPGGQAQADTIRQLGERDNRTLRGRTRLVYTEPVGRNKRMELFYEWNKAWQNADRRTFDFNPASGAFDRPNELFTNQLDNDFTTHEGGLNLRVQKLRYDYTLGLRLQQSLLSSASPGDAVDFRRTFFNVFPQALFNYNFSERRRLRFSYQPDTREPSLTELQPVPDNSNPQFLRLGNPELKPEFAHRLNLNYNFFDLGSLRSLFATAYFTATANRIVNANSFDELGRQISRPVNSRGAFNAGGFAALGIPLRGRTLNLNLSSQLRYERYISLLNERENDTRAMQARQTVRLSYSREDKFDLGLAANASYNRATYSLQAFLNNAFFNYGAGIDVSWTLPLGLRLQGEVNYSVNTGGSEVYNNRAVIISGGLARDFLANNQGTLELRAFDLLNQNNSIFRNTGENFIEDVANTTLRQYFLLRFSYRFGQFGGEGGGVRMIRF